MKKVFVSHSSKDSEIVKQFIDKILIDGLSIPRDSIFCTSTKGTKIETGKDWRDHIKENITSAELLFMIITPNYKESEMCQNELGAMWQLEIAARPLVVEPIDFKNCGVLNVVKQGGKLLDSDTIDDIRDIVVEKKLNVSKIDSANFNDKKNEFIATTKDYIKKTPFPNTMSREILEAQLQKNQKQESLIAELLSENRKLVKDYEVLVKAKTKEEIKDAFKIHSNQTELEEFDNLCQKLSSLLSEQKYYIKSLIYKELSCKDIGDPDEDDYADIRKACAENKIKDDHTIIWEEDTMDKIANAFYSLKNFIKDKIRSNEFRDNFGEENKFPCDIENSKFWENILNVKIKF